MDKALKMTRAQLLDLLADWTVRTNPRLYAGYRDDRAASDSRHCARCGGDS
jgi:hypothetical protein